MNNTLNILMQTNDYYCPFAGVAMESLFENNTDIENLNLYLISDNISDANLNKVNMLSKKFNRKIVIIDGNKISSLLSELGCPKFRNSYTAYYKLFASQYINEDIDRLLYLDSDIIVNGSLRELIDFDFGDNYLAMVNDFGAEQHKKYLLADKNMTYHNSGVILFQFKKCKEIGLTEQIIHHISKVKADYPLPDQDILNIVFAKNIAELDLKFNFTTDLLIYKDYNLIKKVFGINYDLSKDFYNALSNPVVIHCLASICSRPWCRNSKHPAAKLWSDYLSKTPWNDFERVPDKRMALVKFQEMLYKILPKTLFAFITRHTMAFMAKYRNTYSKVSKNE